MIAAKQPSAKLQSAKSTEDENSEGKTYDCGATHKTPEDHFGLFSLSRNSSRTKLNPLSLPLSPPPTLQLSFAHAALPIRLPRHYSMLAEEKELVAECHNSSAGRKSRRFRRIEDPSPACSNRTQPIRLRHAFLFILYTFIPKRRARARA